MKKYFCACLFACFAIMAMNASALEVDDIQKAVREKNLSWSARENRFTGMTLEEKRALGAALPEPAEVIEKKHAPPGDKTARRLSFDAHFDWRDRDGADYVTSVKDQGAIGSCTAFCVTAQLESRVMIMENDPTLNPDLSERFVYSYAGGGSRGWFSSQIADFLMIVGAVEESVLPYDEWDGSRPTGSAAPYLENNDVYRAASWSMPITGYLSTFEDQVKELILDGPVSARMLLYEDFYAYDGGVYERAAGEAVVYHYLLIVGWDDAGDYWICKNSWGEDWGEDGYVRMKKSSKALSGFPSYIVVLEPGGLTPMRNYGQYSPFGVPDASWAQREVSVRGLINAQDLTFELSADHQREEDLRLTLEDPDGDASVMLSQAGGEAPGFEGVYLNDRCSSSLSGLIATLDSVDMGYNRGCAAPEEPLSDLYGGLYYGDWTLTIEDLATGETGFLNHWSLLFAAEQAPNFADGRAWLNYR